MDFRNVALDVASVWYTRATMGISAQLHIRYPNVGAQWAIVGSLEYGNTLDQALPFPSESQFVQHLPQQYIDPGPPPLSRLSVFPSFLHVHTLNQALCPVSGIYC